MSTLLPSCAPRMELAIERMPSSVESESAFSAATEAESEMTDGGFEDADIRTEYFLSYPTDCLSAYELIKKRSLLGVRALDDVSATVVVGTVQLRGLWGCFCARRIWSQVVDILSAQQVVPASCSEKSRAVLEYGTKYHPSLPCW